MQIQPDPVSVFINYLRPEFFFKVLSYYKYDLIETGTYGIIYRIINNGLSLGPTGSIVLYPYLELHPCCHDQSVISFIINLSNFLLQLRPLFHHQHILYTLFHQLILLHVTSPGLLEHMTYIHAA